MKKLVHDVLYKMYTFKNRALKPFIIFSLLVLFYAWGLTTVQYKYFPHSILKATANKFMTPDAPITNEQNIYWANEIKTGGYILYFRHSNRPKIDGGGIATDLIIAYDTLNLLGDKSGDKDIGGMSCLTSQGKKDAKLVGQLFVKSGIKVDKVVSSPLCRSKETATIAFGRIDKIENSLIYRNLVSEDTQAKHSETLKKILIKYHPEMGKNTVITAHTHTLEFYSEDIFNSYDKNFSHDIDESGFYVIQNIENNLFLRHKFKSFSDFAYGLQLIKQPLRSTQ